MLQEETTLVAIIVGMITGSLCMVFALFYLMQLSTPPRVWGIVGACVGGGVFLLSAILMAVTTLAQQRSKKRAATAPAEPKAPESPEPTPVEAPEPEDLSPGSAMPELDEDDFESSFELAGEEEESKEEKGTA